MKTLILYLAIVGSAAWIFSESFFIEFFQDDFFVLKVSNANSFFEVLSFFIPRSDVQFYRPLSHELWYFFLRKINGTQPLAWHGSGWILWGTMVILVYKIGIKFLRRKPLQYLLPILYGLSSIHYSTLFWSINTSYLLVSVFFFAALLVWWSEHTPAKKSLCLLILFILGLLSNEFMITLLPVLVVDGLLCQRIPISRFLSLLIPMMGITVFYFILRFMYPSDIGSYPVEVSAIPSSYRWFIFFFLSWPEGIKDNMLTFWKIRPEFFHYFLNEIHVWSISSVILSTTSITAFFMALRAKNIDKNFLLSLLFFISWFLVSLLPIVVIPSHITPHHGNIALAGFLLLILFPVDRVWRNIPPAWRYMGVYVLTVLWLLSARTTVVFNNDTYWIKRRSDIAKTWMVWTKNTYPHLADGSVVTIPTEEKEVRVALNEGEAIRQWYDNPSLQVKFSDTQTD